MFFDPVFFLKINNFVGYPSDLKILEKYNHPSYNYFYTKDNFGNLLYEIIQFKNNDVVFLYFPKKLTAEETNNILRLLKSYIDDGFVKFLNRKFLSMEKNSPLISFYPLSLNSKKIMEAFLDQGILISYQGDFLINDIDTQFTISIHFKKDSDLIEVTENSVFTQYISNKTIEVDQFVSQINQIELDIKKINFLVKEILDNFKQNDHTSYFISTEKQAVVFNEKYSINIKYVRFGYCATIGKDYFPTFFKDFDSLRNHLNSHSNKFISQKRLKFLLKNPLSE